MTSTYTSLPDNKALEKSIELGQVQIVEDTASHIGIITVPEFTETLKTALIMADYLSRSGTTAKYVLDANITEIDRDTFGFNLTTTVATIYNLRNKATGETVFKDEIRLPYEAKFGEAFEGTIRSRISTAKAARENVTHLIKVLARKVS